MHPISAAKVYAQFLLLNLLICRTATSAAPPVVSLPSLSEWSSSLLDQRQVGESTTISIPVNYKVGRLQSPQSSSKEGEVFTATAEIETTFKFQQPQFYRTWIELEFLNGAKVIGSAASPELAGDSASRLLGVTGVAPSKTTAVRMVLCAQNKLWTVVENTAVVSNVRLQKLSGQAGSSLRLRESVPFGREGGVRSAAVTAETDWPDGTAVAVTSTRGDAPPVVLTTQGTATIPLEYSEDTVGSADVTGRVQSLEASQVVADPHAGKVSISAALSKGANTAIRVQLIRNGKMQPGRYQKSAPGIFVTPPWSFELEPGDWQLRILRGPHFRTIERTVRIESGNELELNELQLEREVDLTSRGWYCGDADGDVYHGERIYTDVNARTAADISQAMGLEWAGIANWGSPTPKTWSEARDAMNDLSNPHFKFLWTDEKPKTLEGHVCFAGLERPGTDPFGWGWMRPARELRNFEVINVLRKNGAATFVNHPLRWWVSSGRFKSNMYASLPFDLCAAGLIDGVNINEGEHAQQLWSMLLDHGYRVAATGGADFGLDRPEGPVPGVARLYCYCPGGLSERALAAAVRDHHTIVSTGPTVIADIDGRPPGTTVAAGNHHKISIEAWARVDEPDPLMRIELWAHGKAIASFEPTSANHTKHTFDWLANGDWNWVAVKAISKRGWAMTSAFYAESEKWQRPHPVVCELTIEASGASEQDLKAGRIEVWDNLSSLSGSTRLSEHPLMAKIQLDVPVTASVLIRTGDGTAKEQSVFDSLNVEPLLDRIAQGEQKEQPLLDWRTYEEVLKRSRRAIMKVSLDP